MLELEDVVWHYRSSEQEPVRAVDGVSLELRPGEMLALQGPSGSGKTTLLFLIAGLLKPQGGALRYAGRDLGSLNEREASDYRLTEVGFIYQRFHLEPRTSALENASTGLLLAGYGVAEAEAIARVWLERVGLADKLKRWPEQMSGGERQRVAIARALAGDPNLILADEPTGSLDSSHSREVVQLLRSVACDRDASVLLVTHDAEIAALADRQYTLRDGKLSRQIELTNQAVASGSSPLRTSTARG